MQTGRGATYAENIEFLNNPSISNSYLSSKNLQGGMYGNGPMAGGPNDIRPPVPGAGAAQVQGDNIDAAFAQHAAAQQVINANLLLTALQLGSTKGIYS